MYWIRTFDAPRGLVWRAWTDPEILHQWYGPGIETVIHQYDLKPGGSWLNEMKMRGMSDYSRMDFKDVVAEEKLVWHHASTDADWNIIANPDDGRLAARPVDHGHVHRRRR